MNKRDKEVVLENNNHRKLTEPKEISFNLRFCRIFSEERKKVKSWIETVKPQTKKEKDFISRVIKSLKKIDYDYWISVIEPSVINDKIKFIEGEEVATAYNGIQWERMCRKYFPSRGSRIAKLDELILWYALRIVEGYWTLNFVCNNSSKGGNYRNSPNSSKKMEASGTRICGGFADGQGNGCKIVKYCQSFAVVGGKHYEKGDEYPVAHIEYNVSPSEFIYHCSSVVVLTKGYKKKYNKTKRS